MITKRNFNPIKVASYVWRDVVLAGAVTTGVVIAYELGGVPSLGLPFAPLGIVGTALAIFLAFRANTAFARWNEAAQLWANIVNASRIFARLIITFVDSHAHLPSYDKQRARAFQREMVYRHLAWVNAVRLRLRKQDGLDELYPYLAGKIEIEAVRMAKNRPNFLMLQQGNRIYEAMADNTLQGFDSFQLEGQLAALSAAFTATERLKNIPIPRQYDYFTRLFIRLFILTAPFFLVDTMTTNGAIWLLIPVIVLLAFLFTTIERIGAINEAPFENQITDVPMSAICRDIERDLRELLGEGDLPAPLQPQDGYLW